MPQYCVIARAIRRGSPASVALFLAVGWCGLAGAEAFGPAMRAPDGVPASWRDVKIDWKGTWEETLAGNLDPGKNWLKALEADESLRQAAGVIARLREIEVLEAMIAHFPQAGAKRQEAYRAVARAYAGLGDRLHAVQWLNRLIADYPADKALAASALAEIIGLTRPFGALPDAHAWAEHANEGIDRLIKAGALPSNHPAVVAAREAMCVAMREGQCPESARRVLDSLPPADRKEGWWQKARAELLLGEGHIAQAEAIYRQAGDAPRAGALRDQLGLYRPDVEVSPPPAGLEEKYERLLGAIRMTGGKALRDLSGVQDVLARCADSGALQTVDDDLQASAAALLDQALRGLGADLSPLRQWQQQKADARVDAALSEGAEDEVWRLVRRYPWARRVQEMLIERGEQALREGRYDRAAEDFENAAAHADDPTLLAQARAGQRLATAPEGDDKAPPAWPRSPAGRMELPAAMAARAPWLGGPWESWCLGPWAIRRIDCLGSDVMLFGPRYVACYDRATLALRWQHAGEDNPATGEGAEALAAPAWRPVAMGSPRSAPAAGRAVYALLARGQGGADLSAFDPASGRAIWTTRGRPEWEALRILSDPAAAEEAVYLLAMEQDLQRTCTLYLMCLAGDDARTLWKRRLGTLTLSEQAIDMAQYACGVAVHQGAVYVSTNMGILARCDTRTGAMEWVRTYHPAIPGDGVERRPGRRGRQGQQPNRQAQAPGRARREGSVPLVAGGQVFFAPRDHSGVMALDRQTGKLAWECLLVPSDQFVGLAGRTIVLRDADELAALAAQTGEELWHRPIDSLGSPPALVAGGDVLIAAGESLLRLSAQTGQTIEEAAVPRAIGAEHLLLPGGAIVALAEEPLLERTLAPEAGGAPGPLKPPFVKRWTLPCRDPLLVIPPASTVASDFAGVLSGARFYCLRLRPACRLAWQMAFREPPDSVGFQGSLVVFAAGADLTAVDKETGAVRWRRTLPFEADLIAGDDRLIVAGRSSGEAPVAALSPQTGATLWCRWFGQEPRFFDRRLRWIALAGEPGAPPALRLFWGGALFAREGPRPADVLVDPATGDIRDVRLFLPREPIWPARLSFGGDTRTRLAEDATLPWPFRGPFRPDAVAYLDRDLVGRFALRDDGADLAGGWNPPADSSLEAARRWAGLFATPAGCYVKRLGQLAFFDAQAKREILFHLPRTAERKNAFAIGDFREAPAEQLTVVSVAPGRPYETAGSEGDGDAGGRGGDQFNIVGLRVSEFTKTGLHDDAGNGDVTLIYYGRGTGSQVRIQSRGLPEAGSNLVATLLNGMTREHYYPQPVKMTGLASLGWAKYDVFLYGDSVKGPVSINGGNAQANAGANFNTQAHRTTFIRNVNYVRFEGVSGDSFIVDFDGEFSAIQVVDASGRPGPRGSLGVRWTGPGPVLGPDDKVGAEVPAGSWYNIVTDFANRKSFVLSGGPQTTVAGKKVCGFVDIFDRKTGQVLNSLPLPAGEAPAPRTSYDCQAKLLDDALLVTDANGLYLFRTSPDAPKP